MITSDRIRHFIISELIPSGNGPELTDTAPLIESGIIDSFGIMSLLGFLEDNFSIQISGDDLVPENFSSIATITEFVSQKNGNQVGGGF